MTEITPSVGGVILCGGQSRRMGESKAWVRCGDEHLLQRMVRIVSGVVQPVVVAARPGQSLPPLPGKVKVVRDEVADFGPLAGLAVGFSALADACDAAFVASCDQPLLRLRFVERLIALLAGHPGVVPRHEGLVHPLTAVYRLDTHPILAAQLERGDRRVTSFVERCGAHIVEAKHLAAADPNLDSLRNANDAETLDDLLRHLND